MKFLTRTIQYNQLSRAPQGDNQEYTVKKLLMTFISLFLTNLCFYGSAQRTIAKIPQYVQYIR